MLCFDGSTTGVLNKVKASAYESEAIGHGALEALGNQHEVLLRSSEKVEEVIRRLEY